MQLEGMILKAVQCSALLWNEEMSNLVCLMERNLALHLQKFHRDIRVVLVQFFSLL